MRTVSREYDTQGRLTKQSTPEGTIAYEYDNLGRKTATKSFGPGFTPANSDDFEQVTRYSYDTLGRLQTVEVTERDDVVLATSEATTYAYNLIGSLDETADANGVISDYEYDDLNRLLTLTHFLDDGIVNGSYDAGSDTLVASFDYTLRADGKRTAVSETFSTGTGTLANDIAWTYDNLGRLVSEEFDSSDNSLDFYQEYDYGLTGNREAWRKYDAPGGTLQETVTYTPDANDRLLTESSTLGTTTTYGYTGTQQTAKTVTSASLVTSAVNYEYDLQGRLSGIVTEAYNGGVLQSRTRLEYDYDTRGLRIEAIERADGDLDGSFETLGATTTFLVDHNNFTGYQQVIEEVRKDAAGNELKRITTTFGLDEISETTREFDAQGNVTIEQTLFFIHDGQGSVRLLLTATATLAVRDGFAQVFHFDAYGNPHGFTLAQSATSKGYRGEQTDLQTGFQNLRARPYNPRTGMFIGRDPFIGSRPDPQSFNKYLYTHADPTNNIDPTGRFISAVGSLVVSGIQSVGRGLNQAGAFIALQYARASVYLFSAIASVQAAFIRFNGRIMMGLQRAQQIPGNVWTRLVNWTTRITRSPSLQVPGGGLRAHEARGGHAIARHVGKSFDYLQARLGSQPNIPAASSFPDLATAEETVARALQANQGAINNWLTANANRFTVFGTNLHAVGASVAPGQGVATPVSSVSVFLTKDSTWALGYRIITAYPDVF